MGDIVDKTRQFVVGFRNTLIKITKMNAHISSFQDFHSKGFIILPFGFRILPVSLMTIAFLNAHLPYFFKNLIDNFFRFKHFTHCLIIFISLPRKLVTFKVHPTQKSVVKS